MKWEEELVLKNRRLKFDYGEIGKSMQTVIDEIETLSKKYNVDIKAGSNLVDTITIDCNQELGNKSIVLKVDVNRNKGELVIKSASKNDVISCYVTINGGVYNIRYINLPDKEVDNYTERKELFLTKDILTEIYGNIIKLNNMI